MSLIYVIAAATINFILGGVWYLLFKKEWIKAWGLSQSQLKDHDPKPYLIAFIGSLWTSYGLFVLLKHLQPKNLEELLTIAVGTWILILVGLGAKHYAFARVKGKAFIIDYGLDLVGLIVMSFIINEAI